MSLRPFLRLLAALSIAAALAGCDDGPDKLAKPAPLEPTRDAIGHYCNMIVVDHHGPKGQIHLASAEAPVWFSSVRDTIAFTILPEEADDIVALYVNDMAKATNWNAPEPGAWVEAEKAWYVVGSDRRGGMGAPEVVPFSDREKGEAFAERHGGHVVAFDAIPQEAILGDAEPAHGMAADGEMQHDSDMHHGHEMHQDMEAQGEHDGAHKH